MSANIKWRIIFSREGFSYFITSLAFDGFINDMKKSIGWGYRDQACISKGNLVSTYYSNRDASSFKKFIKNKDDKFLLKINDLINKQVSISKKQIAKINSLLKNKKLTSNDLKEIVTIFYKNYRSLYSIYRFPTLIDEHNDGIIKHSILKKLAQTKDSCGYFFTKTDSSTLVAIKEKIADELKVPKDLVLFMNYQEIIQSLNEKRLKINPKEIISRKNFYVAIGSDEKIKLYITKQAQKMAKKIINEKKKYNTNIVEGKIAFKGMIKGKVKNAVSVNDLKNIKSGQVLVCPMTTIKYMPYLKKFSAIITDEGGITSHAAIISREMQIPCVIGTKIATKVLKDGDEVEVDANKGVVRKIK